MIMIGRYMTDNLLAKAERVADTQIKYIHNEEYVQALEKVKQIPSINVDIQLCIIFFFAYLGIQHLEKHKISFYFYEGLGKTKR